MHEMSEQLARQRQLGLLQVAESRRRARVLVRLRRAERRALRMQAAARARAAAADDARQAVILAVQAQG